MGEVIYIRDFIQARRRAKRRREMQEAIEVMEESLEFARYSYGLAPLDERFSRASKIRQLRELVAYARRYV